MSEHRGATDAVHRETLPSEIQRASWLTQCAAAGETVPLEVITLFVGNDADVDVEVRTRDGEPVGKTAGKVVNGLCEAAFPIPADTEATELYFEAKLPKHGLTRRSMLLRVEPRRSLTNARWDRKEARHGDTVKLTADTARIADGTEATISIFEHDEDGNHDFITELAARVEQDRIAAEWEYAYHEDTDDIPTDEEVERGYRAPEYFFRVTIGSLAAESELLTFKDWIYIDLKDDTGEPVAGAAYVVRLADGSEIEGKLDDKGCASIENVVPGPYWVAFPDHDDVA